MEDRKLSRSDVLKTGLIGLTVLGAGCARRSPLARQGEAPEEIDPKLLKYRESGRIQTGLDWSRGLACDMGTILVAGDMVVRRLNASGKVLENFDLPDASQAVAVGPDGAVFASTNDQIIPLRGTPFASEGARARIVGLAVAEDAVYAADAGNRSLARYDRKGKMVWRKEGFVVPSPYMGVAKDHNSDNVFVSNPGRHQIRRFHRDGLEEVPFGEQGHTIDRFCGCCNPTNLSLLPNGNLVTSEKGTPRVKVIDPRGELVAVVAPPTAFNSQTSGLELAVDGERILVLDPWEGAVRVFEPV